jgi:hypothetical protein
LSDNALTFGLWMLMLFVVPSADSRPSATGQTVNPQIFQGQGVGLVIRPTAGTNNPQAETA